MDNEAGPSNHSGARSPRRSVRSGLPMERALRPSLEERIDAAEKNITQQNLLLAVLSKTSIEKNSKPGADVNFKDEYGDTPLHLAVEHRNLDAVSSILSAPKLDVTSENVSYYTALDVAGRRTPSIDYDLVKEIGKCIIVKANGIINNHKTKSTVIQSASNQKKRPFEEMEADGDTKHNPTREEVDTILGMLFPPGRKYNHAGHFHLLIDEACVCLRWPGAKPDQNIEAQYTEVSTEEGSCAANVEESDTNKYSTIVEALVTAKQIALQLKTNSNPAIPKEKHDTTNGRSFLASLLREKKRTEKKIDHWIQEFNKIDNSLDATLSYVHAYSFVCFVEIFAVQDSYLENINNVEDFKTTKDQITYFKKEYFRLIYDIKVFNPLRNMLTHNAQWLSLQDLENVLSDWAKESGKRISQLFDALRDFAVEIRDQLRESSVPLSSKKFDIFTSDILKKKGQFDRKKVQLFNENLKEFFNELNSLNSPEAVSLDENGKREMTGRLLFNFIVNICPGISRIGGHKPRKVTSLRDKLLHVFYSYGVDEWQKNVELITSAVPELYKCFVADEIYTSFERIDIDATEDDVGKHLRQHLQKANDSFGHIKTILPEKQGRMSFGNRNEELSYAMTEGSETRVDKYLLCLAPLLDSIIDETEEHKHVSFIQKKTILDSFIELGMTEEGSSQYTTRHRNLLNKVSAIFGEKKSLVSNAIDQSRKEEKEGLQNKLKRERRDLSSEVEDILSSLKALRGKKDTESYSITMEDIYQLCQEYNRGDEDCFPQGNKLQDKAKKEIKITFRCLPSRGETRKLLLSEGPNGEVKIDLWSVVLNLLQFDLKYKEYTLPIEDVDEIFEDSTFVDVLVSHDQQGLKMKNIYYTMKNIQVLNKVNCTAPYIARVLQLNPQKVVMVQEEVTKLMELLLSKNTASLAALLETGNNQVSKAFYEILLKNYISSDIMLLLLNGQVAIRQIFKSILDGVENSNLFSSERVEIVLKLLLSAANEKVHDGVGKGKYEECRVVIAEVESFALKVRRSLPDAVVKSCTQDTKLLLSKVELHQGLDENKVELHQGLDENKLPPITTHYKESHKILSELLDKEILDNPKTMLVISRRAHLNALMGEEKDALDGQLKVYNDLVGYVFGNKERQSFTEIFGKIENYKNYRNILGMGPDYKKYLNVFSVRKALLHYKAKQQRLNENEFKAIHDEFHELYEIARKFSLDKWINPILKDLIVLHNKVAARTDFEREIRGFHSLKAVETNILRYERLVNTISIFDPESDSQVKFLKQSVDLYKKLLEKQGKQTNWRQSQPPTTARPR